MLRCCIHSCSRSLGVPISSTSSTYAPSLKYSLAKGSKFLSTPQEHKRFSSPILHSLRTHLLQTQPRDERSELILQLRSLAPKSDVEIRPDEDDFSPVALLLEPRLVRPRRIASFLQVDRLPSHLLEICLRRVGEKLERGGDGAEEGPARVGDRVEPDELARRVEDLALQREQAERRLGLVEESWSAEAVVNDGLGF